MKDQQILSIYHSSIHLLSRLTICATSNDFRTYPQAKSQLICNEIQCHDTIWTRTCKNQIFEWFLSAIWHLWTFHFPYKSPHEPYYEGMALALDYYMLHCRRSNLQLLNLLLWVFSQVTNQIDTIDSTLLKYTRSLVSDQIHFAWLKHNSLKTTVHYTINLQVDEISWHMEHRCTVGQFQWTFVWAVVWIMDFFYPLQHSSSTCSTSVDKTSLFGISWKHPESIQMEHVLKEHRFNYWLYYYFP